MKKLLSLFAILFCLSFVSLSNSDSLNTNWQNTSALDSVRGTSFYYLISKDYLFNNPDTAFKMARKLYFFAQKKRLTELEYKAVKMLGLTSFYTDQYKRAINYYTQYLDYQLKNRNAANVADALHCIALTYVNIGDLVRGLKNYQKSLTIRQEINDLHGLGITLNNIGNIYYELEDLDKALDYYNRSFEIKKKTNNRRVIGNALNNIGLIYHEQGKLDSALYYYKKSLDIYFEIDYKSGQSLTYTNIGAMLEETGQLDSALLYFKISLDLSLNMKSFDDASNSYSNIASILIKKNKLDSALNYALNGLAIAKEIGSINFIEQASKVSYEIYKKQGKGMQALEMHEEYILMRDSIKSENAKKGLVEMEIKHEIEKEELAEEQQEKEAKMLANEANERRNTLEYSGITMGLFLLFGLVFLVGRFHLPNWALELSVFLPFLILFEFLLVLTDPFIDSYAGGDPMVKLLINACLAGLIFPLHGFFERTLKRRIFKSN